jgi:LysR family nitrogen assimilation transcriptional regulator
VEFRQLKYFLAVVDSGSISKAAARLFIAQSALSQQIVQLEQYLDTTLLHRSSRGVSLTESGLAFHEHAQAIMRQIGYARAAATQQLSDSPTGAVTLGLSPTVALALALPLFLAARKELPGVTLQITEESTGNLTDQLKQGQLNLAVLVDDGQLEGFPRKRIIEEQLFVICATHGKYSSTAKRIKLKDAFRLAMVLPSVQHGTRQRLEKAVEEHGLVIENMVAQVPSLGVLKSAVLAGIGVTLSPLAPFSFELNQGLVQAQAIHDPGISRTLSVFSSRDITITRASCAVSKLVVRIANELCNTGGWQGAVPLPGDNVDLTT